MAMKVFAPRQRSYTGMLREGHWIQGRGSGKGANASSYSYIFFSSVIFVFFFFCLSHLFSC